MPHAKSGKRTTPPAREVTAPPAALGPCPQRRMVVGVCVVLVLVCTAIYGQTVSHGFVNYDDDLYVTANPQVQTGLSLQTIGWAFVTKKALYFHPLTWMSLMLDHDLYGMQAGGYHVTSLLFHAAASVLLFLALRLLTGALWPSAAVAALFAVHPLNVESVAWIGERKGVLSAFFWMLALCAYGLYARRGGALRYAAVAAAFLGGLMSKPMVLTLPFALLLLDCWPLGRVNLAEPLRVTAGKAARLALEKIPLLLLTALSALSTFVMQAGGNNIDLEGRVSLSPRCANAAVVYELYLVKAVWPSGLAIYYPYPEAYPLWQVAGAVLVLAAITLFCLGQARRRPYLIVGWLWYLGTLVPVIGLVRIGSFSHADRYTYIPLIGVFIMLAWGVADLATALRVPKRAVALASGAVVALFALCSGVQTTHWRNSETLFTHAIAVGQASRVAYNDLAQYAIEQGRDDDAKVYLSKMLELEPDSVYALGNLGMTVLNQGNHEEAKTYLTKALDLDPNSVTALNGLGMIAAARGRHDEAKGYLTKAMGLDPKNADVLYNLGVVAKGEKRYDEARTYLTKALEVKPGNVKALNNLGVTAMEQGSIDEAVTYLKKALELKPNHANALCNLGKLSMDLKKFDEAEAYLKKALELDPKNLPALHNLGLCLMNRQQYEEAQVHFRKALEINPQYVRSMRALGDALAKLGRQEEADTLLKKAAELEQARTVKK